MSGLYIPDNIEIEGGRKLATNATVSISGAKNEVLGAMAAAVLTDQAVELSNVPYISDVLDMGHILIELGADVQYNPEEKLMRIHAREIASNELSDRAAKFRASYYLWGALLSRFSNTGEFKSLRIKNPGGCGLGGNRKTNYHFDMLRNIFRVEETLGNDMLELALPGSERNYKTEPIFATDLMSHGATMHWLLSVATNPEFRVFYNASLEPEVPHLLQMLNKMGANLRGTGTTAITNMGKKGLLSGGCFEIMPDRMEASSYILLAMLLRDKITVNGMNAASCRPCLNSIAEIMKKAAPGQWNSGLNNGSSITFDFRNLRDFPGQKFVMSPFPGKETDLHQIWAPLLATASSESEIYDPVWAKRKDHLPELAKFGIESSYKVYEESCYEDIEEQRRVANRTLQITIRPSNIKDTMDAVGMDLRGTFGLFAAAAKANRTSCISNPGYALRGYPNLIGNLQGLGIPVFSSLTPGTVLAALPPIKQRGS